MRESFLFVRPPRPLWPFSGPSTGFWPPLAFASLAAALRQAVPDLDVAILDAPILEMGWKTLTAELHRRRPTYIGIGEEAVSCAEGLRLARLARETGAQVIAGGCAFAALAPELLATGWVDAVVHGEGEITLPELVQALRLGRPDDRAGVPGISYRDGDRTCRTAHRELIGDLDALPMPAYDLLPVERYGRGSRNHPALASIESSRGCLDSCSFCVLWRQMGQFADARLTPRLRVKSPERLLEEIRVLRHRYGRRYLGWVDPCFNAHPDVPAALAERLLREGLHVGQSAWVRADGLLRDEASGALGLCVEAGLNELYLGIERPDSEGLAALNKRERKADCERACRLLAENYPQVFAVGSFIYGLPGDTPETVRRIYRMSLELGLDKAFFIPLTPLPGTPFWEPELWDGTGERLRALNFLPRSTPDSPQPALDRALLRCVALDWRPARLRGYWHGFTRCGARKRRLTWRLFTRSTQFAARLVTLSVLGQRDHHGMILPRWYDR